MKQLDLTFSFGFPGGYTAEDNASWIDFSDELYNQLKSIYQDCGENELCTILETEELDAALEEELRDIVQQQKADLIEVQHDNGDDYDPDTGELYDFDELIIEIYIDVPSDWD